MKKFTLFLMPALFLPCLWLGKTYAHCDTLDGPVVQDARLAFERADVTPTLKWVNKAAEGEIKAAFDIALKESTIDKEKAQMKFFETLVRVHRLGEGAEFGGLKPSGTVEPEIAASDRALESGSIDELVSEMSNRLTEETKKRFEHVSELQKHKEESVEYGRRFVEAYIEYVHYIENLHHAIEIARH